MINNMPRLEQHTSSICLGFTPLARGWGRKADYIIASSHLQYQCNDPRMAQTEHSMIVIVEPEAVLPR